MGLPPYPLPDPGLLSVDELNRLRVCCWNFWDDSFMALDVTAGGGTPSRWTWICWS
jgi:hypothetical protein